LTVKVILEVFSSARFVSTAVDELIAHSLSSLLEAALEASPIGAQCAERPRLAVAQVTETVLAPRDVAELEPQAPWHHEQSAGLAGVF
jgi:hypothetical protein